LEQNVKESNLQGQQLFLPFLISMKNVGFLSKRTGETWSFAENGPEMVSKQYRQLT
jgi:predicted metalloprotease